MSTTLVLYGFWRSLATYRVRVALNLKGLVYRETAVDLLKGEQFDPAYRGVNPQQVLPALQHGGLTLTQSMPIVEYLDETWPEPALLPADPAGRARVRALAQITVCDVHPLIVPRVRHYLAEQLHADEAARLAWAGHWFDRGTAAIEARLREDGVPGRYAHGDQITLADVALMSHVIGARLFESDLASAPRLLGLAERCLAHDAFARAHPSRQAGAPAA